MNDADILKHLLDGDYDLAPRTREAFERWRPLVRSSVGLPEQVTTGLTEPQRNWLRSVAHQKGLIGDPGAANLFSKMSPAKQAEQRARAAKVKLPWE